MQFILYTVLKYNYNHLTEAYNIKNVWHLCLFDEQYKNIVLLYYVSFYFVAIYTNRIILFLSPHIAYDYNML